MESKLNELTGKFKALNLIMGRVDNLLTEREKESLKRTEQSLRKKTNAIYELKEEIEELKFTNKESDEDVQTWATETETKLIDAKEKIELVRRVLSEIESEETIIKREKDEANRREAIDAETEKQMAIEKAKLERVHKDEERKRELEHQDLILQQQMKFEKARESNTEKSKELQVKNVKLPKLSITKFTGKFCDWLPFWNTFKAEIDSTDLPSVSKFGYLRELLEPTVRSEVAGLPFNTEGYERAKNILESEYGKTSEIINAYIQDIINLPVINGSSPAKIHEFYKILSHNVQSLQTLGKIERVNGNTRNVLEKLKEIKADLVRGEEGWQDWDLPRLVVALKKWKDINLVENSDDNQNKRASTRPGQRSNFYHAKDGERKRRACIYCNDSNHSSKDCTKITSVSERKKVLA
jgi:hypothetical protein